MIAIVGAGITGLAAAFELQARGVPFRVFEASSRSGGLIHTEHIDGYTIEAGADSVLAQKPAAMTLFTELGLASRVVSTSPPRTSYVLKNGKLYALPSPSVLGIPLSRRATLRYPLLPRAARYRLALEPFVPRGSGHDESVAAFFRRRFGGATVRFIAEPLLGGIHAGDINALSIHSLFPKFVEAERQHRSVIRTFARTSRPSAPGGAFRSLSTGLGEVVEAIEARLPQGSIAYDAPVERIDRAENGWRITSRGVTSDAAAVIVCAPAHAAAQMLATVDSEIASLCDEVPYVSTASVTLAYPPGAIAHPLDGSGFVVARRYNRLRITACTWVSSKWSGRAPAGHVLLRAYVGGWHDREAVDLPDEAMVDLAVREIGSVVGISGTPLLTRVHRWRNAGAQHNVGQLARMEAIDTRLKRYPGLFVAGSGFRSVGVPDCIADGRTVAAEAGGER